LAGVGLLVVSSIARPARAIVTRPILKTFFESGDKPTQQQFATLIDSSVNLVDDRKLIGLRAYDPKTSYTVGDTVVFQRFDAGVLVPDLAPQIWFAPADELTGSAAPLRDMETDFAGHYGFLPIELQDAGGLVYYGYFQLGMDTPSGLPNDPPAIHVDYVVYNETPGETLTTTLVPEPAGIAAGIGLLMLTRRQRRAKRQE
jgi:hypothetical protein